MESPKIYPICSEPCLSNFSTIFQKGADGINEVSRLKNNNFSVTPEMHVPVICRRNCTRTTLDVSWNKSPYFVMEH